MFGRYISLWEARAADESLRSRGGGGVVTTLLAHLIREGRIRRALVIASSSTPPWAKPMVAASVDEVYAAAGSKYQFIPYGPIIRHFDEKAAMVGLPCQMRAVRHVPHGLRIGLFCGLNLSWRAILYLLRSMGLRLHEIQTLDYRAPGGGLLVRLRDGTVIRHPAYSWLAYFFPHEPCIRCTDATSHYSDISVGDGRHGWCSVIIRTERGMNCFHDCYAAAGIRRNQISLAQFLSNATTSVIQKECAGGYAADRLVRMRGPWLEHLPLTVVQFLGAGIMHRHKKLKQRLLRRVEHARLTREPAILHQSNPDKRIRRK